MIGDGPSQTALHVAAARAAHLRFDPPPHLLEDRLAETLLGDEAEPLIESYADPGSWVLLENRLFLPLRARFAEDRLAAAYRDGVRQLVVLGAGLDSYAFRRPAAQAELRVYEVDHPSTQRWKTERIAALGWEVPATLRFVPCDFEESRVSDALGDTSFDAAAPTIVTWLGVTYYLEPDTTHGALVDLRRILAARSEVILDYQFPMEDLPTRYQELRERMASYLSDVGEPHVNRYRIEAMRETILSAGYTEALLPTREEIYKRYFARLETRIPMSARFGLAVART